MPVFEVCNEEDPEKTIKAIRFSNGTIKEKDKVHLSLKCYTQKKETMPKSRLKGKEQHILTAQIDSMTYVGKNFGDTNRFPTDLCNYYIGVFNKNSGKVKVLPAELIQLDPWVEDKPNVDEVDAGLKSFREKRDALSKEFGSGRSQRAVNKRDKNKLDDDMILTTTKTVVESSQVNIAEAESAGSLISVISHVPPHNKDAEKPDDVYKLKDIIPPEILPSLTTFSEVFFKCSLSDINIWRAEKKYYLTVLDNLDRLSIREDTRLLQCQCIMYLQCLIAVYKMKAQDFRGKSPLPQAWPIPVKEHIMNMFTLEIKEPGRKGKRCVPSRMKDLLLSHIIILCLKLCQFNLPLATLLSDLHMAQKRLNLHVTSLGCTVKKTKINAGHDSYNAILSVPLKFPEVRGKVEKKRIF
ncbi:unnamed protein product [Lymnaea stagnalis]|uniref:DNA-directed RNA polymerase I subunit RPA49 n=1 Tax=Lymnaea stagnalis TaxID=6523 RepID=A0AAV2I234_LYMST